jgi:D-serine deaminase-like pyridoxal phosphate-dependent protein
MTDWYAVENMADVPTPALLLYPQRIQDNLRQMVRQAGQAKRLRPHVKTHKLPQIVQLKLACGIEKFKTATLVETQMVAAAGGRDILLAYPCVGPNIAQLLELSQRYPQCRIATLVDDPATGEALSAPGEDAYQLYSRLAQLPGLTLQGLHAYDGHVRVAELVERRKQWREIVEIVTALAKRLVAAGLPEPQIIAGGSSTSWLWLEVPGVEVGAGTAALWDYGQTLTCPESLLVPAAVLAARVISRPQPDLVCLDVGHKAVAAEMPHPRAMWFGLEDAQAVLQSEEHLVLRTPQAAQYPVGRVVYGLPTHICPTTALYDEVWRVEDGRAIERWPVVARGRQLHPTPRD